MDREASAEAGARAAAGGAAETWRVMAVPLGLDEPESVLHERAAEQAGIDPGSVRALRVGRKAVDARRPAGRRIVRYVVHVDLDLAPETVERAGEDRKSVV